MTDEAIPVPAPKTGDDSGKLPGVVMVTVGMLMLAALFIGRKKKSGKETDELAALCPDIAEVENE